MADLSIEEANKIRIAMGMKPLPVPGAPSENTGPSFKKSKDGEPDDEASTVETRQAASYDNWKKHQEEAEAKAKREAKKEAIKKEREKAARFVTLEGKGLADESEDVDDKTWLIQSKKRQKQVEKARRLQEQKEEEERQAEAARQYTEADLAGVKVGHEVDAFEDGDQILVLKDTAVDADEDDELEAVALREKEKLQEKLDSKKRKRVYDPNDMDDSGTILAQYDEEIEGKKRKAFTLDGQGRTVEELQANGSGPSKGKKQAFSLDILKDDIQVNDYMDISEIKVKKPKKKKSKSTKKQRTDDDDDIFPAAAGDAVEDGAMELDEPEAVAPKPKKTIDESFLEDDDLQVKLAAQRRAALKKRKNLGPAELAKRLRNEASATPDVMETTEESEGPGLVIDETTEFVSGLNKSPAPEEREHRRKSKTPASALPTGARSVDSQGDVDMGHSYAEVAEQEEAAARARGDSAEITTTGLDEEETVDQGLGATLKLLKQRGIVQATETGDLNAIYRERQRFLADKQKVEEMAERRAKEQRERDRQSGRFNHMSAREREEYARRSNAQRDQSEFKMLADVFNKEYKPNVQLNYVDEHGRQMTPKEAFKHLSHQFHGKGSGNQKTQKHLDKIAAEKKRLAESSLDTSKQVGMSNAQGVQSKKNKQAGVRLQ
ncbi:hypothetical protein GQ43DRAFT_10619 [Delitschia confertaspora ATCC 74209]|uniref:SART-1 protein n=1 Tax=Delitschia confertaspora ATCC 74209 TaxID=1513339 RepID=A0A9P4JPP1_9PLEO|nr:hypothetical protein GQ43DRAFT_10619 [Delitschia confertaspora ATCC 74209]